MDEPGSDAMCYWSENHQILFHACEILAGQLYPDRIFTNVGQTGAWHREKGERMALSWLRKRASGGFREWDSNCYFEEDILALAHLADLAEDDQVREFAAIVLDKLLFTMALNSYQGAFGSTHGRTYTPLIKGARLESTAGIGRLLWGMGVFNHHILGTVSLACAQGYELPPIIAGRSPPTSPTSCGRASATPASWRSGATWPPAPGRSTRSPTRRPTTCSARRRTTSPASRATSSTSGRRPWARTRWSSSPTRPASARKARTGRTSGMAT